MTTHGPKSPRERGLWLNPSSPRCSTAKGTRRSRKSGEAARKSSSSSSSKTATKSIGNSHSRPWTSGQYNSQRIHTSHSPRSPRSARSPRRKLIHRSFKTSKTKPIVCPSMSMRNRLMPESFVLYSSSNQENGKIYNDENDDKVNNEQLQREQSAIELVIMLNAAAMRMFALDNPCHKSAESQLYQASRILKQHVKKKHHLYIWAKLVTMSNWGSMYKACGLLKKAAVIFNSAKVFHMKSDAKADKTPDENTRAGTKVTRDPAVVEIVVDICLNLSSIESKLNQHREAYMSAVSAVKLLERLAIENDNPPTEKTKITAAKQLGIAQFNMAVELEHLGSYACAVQAYELSANVSSRCGNEHVRTLAIEARDQLLQEVVDPLLQSL